MQKNNYEVDILINGKKAKEYLHNGKMYIEGRKGTKYSIRIKNNCWTRILAIPTVDGLSVITGREGNYNSSGYIIDANSSITIDGWRKNNQEVAEFYFSGIESSYAKKVDKSGNQGVIGVAVYEEEQISITTFTNNAFLDAGTCTNYLCASGTSMSTQSFTSCSASQDVGTGWGDTKRSEVTTSTFEENKSSLVVFELFYNTRSELKKEGISFKPAQYISPRAFPNEYCQPPKK